jgi:2-iminoacetate synthase ThiH
MDPAVMEIKSLVDGRTVEVQINYLDEWEITDKLPPQVKAAAEAAEAVKRAEAELKRAQTVARNRAREAYKALAEAGLEELLVGQAQ